MKNFEQLSANQMQQIKGGDNPIIITDGTAGFKAGSDLNGKVQ
jgi:bacteriocin-like protein